mmetsp:Transcript_558/g.1075  ORF Transcript_558/g.1075 Transcript_558/m.1075 type:complete len:115 (-) Transcript_558:581-925(-)
MVILMTLALAGYKLSCIVRGVPYDMFQFDPAMSKREKIKVCILLIISPFFMLGWILGHTWASLNIVQSHAYMLTGLHSPTMLLFYILTCKRTHLLEKLGILVLVTGAVITVSDP